MYFGVCHSVAPGCLRQLDAQCRASSAPLRDLLDAPTALAACCGFDLCHKYILYLYLYLYFDSVRKQWRTRNTSL
jgi:hypothetical protein